MDHAPKQPYAAYGAVLLLAATYCFVGVSFGAAASGEWTVAWRLAAWVVSAAAFAAHIGFERLRLRSTPITAALRVSLAAALGAFGLAAAATVRAWVTGSGDLGALTRALVLFPLLTAVPAFVAALVGAAALALAPALRRRKA